MEISASAYDDVWFEVLESLLLLFNVGERRTEFSGEFWEESFFDLHDPVNCLSTRRSKDITHSLSQGC